MGVRVEGADPQGSLDGALVVVGKDGVEKLRWQDGSPGDESLRAVALSPFGTVAAGGYAEGALRSGGCVPPSVSQDPHDKQKRRNFPGRSSSTPNRGSSCCSDGTPNPGLSSRAPQRRRTACQ